MTVKRDVAIFLETNLGSLYGLLQIRYKKSAGVILDGSISAADWFWISLSQYFRQISDNINDFIKKCRFTVLHPLIYKVRTLSEFMHGGWGSSRTGKISPKKIAIIR